ncbi:MAG: hypothetical protein OEY51_04495 [Cyclobacteriaceae bacterium]|nr:hypothetical protein [Cyclobacteriaceae bacterium]
MAIKVKINPPKPDREMILRHKDFKGFLSTYRKYFSSGGIRYMLYRDRKKLVYIIIILIFLLLMLVAHEEGESRPVPAPIKVVTNTR